MSTAVVYSYDGVAGKLCPKCPYPHWNPLSAYGKNRSTPDGLQGYCKTCLNRANAESKARNLDNVVNLRRSYQRKANENVQAHRLRNPTSRRDEYIRTRPACLARASYYRAIRSKAEGIFTADDILAILDTQRYLCAYCGGILIDSHIDHKIPLSRGGTNWPDNLAIACASCNLSKSNKTDAEFIASLGRIG